MRMLSGFIGFALVAFVRINHAGAIAVVATKLAKLAFDTIKEPQQHLILRPCSDQEQDRMSEANKDGTTALIFIPGCLVKPQQYRGLLQQVQNEYNAHNRQNMWCIVPKVPLGMVNPMMLPHIIKSAVNELQRAGYEGESIFLGGHSLGAAFLLDQLKQKHGSSTTAPLHGMKVAGLLHLGAFAPRRHNHKRWLDAVPQLTLVGDLDGLVRTSRIAESYHHAIVEKGNDVEAKARRPVVLIEGMNHFQIIDGDAHPMKTHRDLEPEITQQEATQATASTVASFLACHSPPLSSSRRLQFQGLHIDEAVRRVHRQRLLTSVDRTAAYLDPMLHAMRLEGYYHMKAPCHLVNRSGRQDDNCSVTADNECAVDCNPGSPWASMMQETVIRETLQNLLPNNNITTSVKDEFHQSWYMVPWANPPCYLPQVHLHHNKPTLSLFDDDENNVPRHDELQVDTVTEAVYIQPESVFDIGFFPNTALELRSKLNSPASILQAALGDTGMAMHRNLTVENMGRTLNAQSITWALQHAPARVQQRYLARGLKLVAGQDIPRHSGPAWIWNTLRLRKSASSSQCGGDGDDECLLVESSVLSTPVDHFIPYVRGKLYVKLLSPARALEWMYTDSLRR